MEKIYPLISIIIPVYNSAEVLKRCLESVKNQTYTNMEVILVDDGSTDSSPVICDEYAIKDRRFIVYHIKNHGVSYARNLGLDCFRGEYCIFIDSDDYVLPEYVETLLFAIKDNHVELATCHRYAVDSENIYRFHPQREDYIEETNIISFKNYDYFTNYDHRTVWAAIYSKKIIKQIRFREELYVGEDTLFFVMALKKAGKMVDISDKLYIYVRYKESLSHGFYDEKKFTEILAWKKIYGLFKDHSINVRKSCIANLGMACMYGLKCSSLCGNLYERNYLELIYTLRKCWSIVIRTNLKKKTKLSYSWLCCMPRIYLMVYRVYYRKIKTNSGENNFRWIT
jgi:glycosyltransferase involved in cell wall biosynthesis